MSTVFTEYQNEILENELVYSTEKEQYDNSRVYTVDIVSKVAYLAGIPVAVYEAHPFKMDIFEELNNFKPAKVVRILNTIRTTIIRNYDKVDSRMRYDMKNLNSMEDLFSKDDIRYLEKNEVQLIKANYKPTNYLMDINKLIADNINKCKDLFPLWVQWDYIRELFLMPKATTASNVKSESLKFTHALNDYPYQMYLGWAPKEQGNFFYNDKKFLEILYVHNNEIFYDSQKVIDNSTSTKKDIYKYLEENEDTIIVVDCENSDPYKLYGTLKSLNAEELHKIKKILLIDDIHTTTAWQILDKLLTIPVEHMLIERVKENKSLVDAKVIAETCKEHYLNKINSFILCSSDSDYWVLITTLADANFLVMVEDEKCGQDIQFALDNAGIVYCSMDDFTGGNTDDIKIRALVSQLQEYIKAHMDLNVNDMLDYAYTQTRIEMSPSEKRQFRDNYVRTMRLVIAPDGKVTIEMKD